jgi:hypothetical protein
MHNYRIITTSIIAGAASLATCLAQQTNPYLTPEEIQAMKTKAANNPQIVAAAQKAQAAGYSASGAEQKALAMKAQAANNPQVVAAVQKMKARLGKHSTTSSSTQ